MYEEDLIRLTWLLPVLSELLSIQFRLGWVVKALQGWHPSKIFFWVFGDEPVRPVCPKHLNSRGQAQGYVKVWPWEGADQLWRQNEAWRWDIFFGRGRELPAFCLGVRTEDPLWKLKMHKPAQNSSFYQDRSATLGWFSSRTPKIQQGHEFQPQITDASDACNKQNWMSMLASMVVVLPDTREICIIRNPRTLTAKAMFKTIYIQDRKSPHCQKLLIYKIAFKNRF